MSSDSSIKYSYKLLPDDPADHDAFQATNGQGPHKRVAQTVAQMIASGEFDGQMVALEGGWGSGKSSVVKMIQSRLDQEQEPSHEHEYRFLTFDAWAHQGDPLRRGFIETIVQDLGEKEIEEEGKEEGREQKKKKADWLEAGRKHNNPNDNVEIEIDKLAKRITETTDKTNRVPSGLALLFALSAFAVPVGVAIATETFEELVPPSTEGAEPHWLFISSLTLCCLPLIVALLHGSTLLIKRPIFIPKKQCEAGIIRRIFKAKNWPILNDTSTVTSNSTTITTADPTSIEFEEAFSKIMGWALDGHANRRLVIVIDNLDRAEPDRALDMWATLQTFFECKNRKRSVAFWKQLCFLAPFDSDAIQHLWHNVKEPEDEEGASTTLRGHQTENSFIDKSFTTRFRIPPILMTQWQDFLADQLREACGGIDDDEIQRVVRVCDLMRTEIKEFKPTPRNIKKVINQAVNLLRQWDGDIESTYTPTIAICFALYSRARSEEQLYDNLVEGTVPSESIKQIIGDDGVSALAGLFYNTTPRDGQLILLERPITTALNSGNGGRIEELLNAHGRGFWAAFERYLNGGLRQYNAWSFVKGCIRVAYALGWTPDIDNSVKRFIRIIAQRVKEEKETLAPTQELAELVVTLKAIQVPDARQIGFDFWSRVTRRDKDEPAPSFAVVKTLVDGLADGPPLTTDAMLVLNISEGEWLDLLEEIGRSGPWDGLEWIRRKKGAMQMEVEAALKTTAENQSFSERERFAVQALNQSNQNASWSKLAPAIREALTSRGAKGTDTEWLLKTLLDMRNAGVKQANTQLDKLAEPAHALDWGYTYNIESNEPLEMLCIYAFLAARPSGQVKTNVGNSSHGQTQLNAHLDSEDTASKFLDLLLKFDDLELLFTLMENRKKIDNLVRATLVSAHKDGHTGDVFSLDAMWRFWNELVDVFGQDVVLKQLPKHGRALVNNIIDHKSLVPEDIDMYDALLQDPDAPWHTDLCQALNRYFNEWTQQEWAEELTNKGIYTGFIEGLFETPAAPKFKDQFMQGLNEVANKMIGEDATLVESIRNHQAWLEHFEASDARDMLAGYILKHILDSKKCPPDQLLEMFGSIIAQQVVREAKDMNLGQFLYQIVNSPTDANLQWLAGLCEEDSLDLRAGTKDDGLFPNKIKELLADESLSEKRRAWLDTIATAALPPDPDMQEPNAPDQ